MTFIGIPMGNPEQQRHIDLPIHTPLQKKAAAHSARSGTFTDNMKLPVHRWFRYSAGFSSEWVESVLKDHNARAVLDPFVGSGTVCVAADKLGIPSYGIEAHPFVFRLGQGKLSWDESIDDFEAAISKLTVAAKKVRDSVSLSEANALIIKCYSEDILRDLYSIKEAYLKLTLKWPVSINSLVFLAINSILRATSHVGTAQWQYVLPNKTKARVSNPYDALKLQAKMMMDDTPDSVFQRTIDSIEAISPGVRAQLKQHLVAANQTILDQFFAELQATLDRQIEQIILIPLHGQQSEFGAVSDAIAFVTNYREDALRDGTFRKYEIIVRYTNNDKIDASFQDKEKAVAFLRYVEEGAAS